MCPLLGLCVPGRAGVRKGKGERAFRRIKGTGEGELERDEKYCGRERRG